MEIKKFEAYNYRGIPLMSIDRKKFIEEFIDTFMDQKMFGYKVVGMTNDTENEIIYIDIESNADSKTIKLDFSDLGIEIGSREWNEDEEDMDEFVPEINLDTEITKQMKNYKKTINKYNL